MRTVFFLSLLSVLIAALLGSSALAQDKTLGPEETAKIVKEIDERQRNIGDYKALIYLERKEKNKNDVVYQLVSYRSDKGNKLMMLFLKPKAEAGKGYLRIGRNLFLYDSTTGKWDRRTDRERIGGTDSMRSDYDESKLSENFTPTYVARQKLGVFNVHHILLNAKKNVDTPFPKVKIWVDVVTGNLLKQQEFSLSGKLMRTAYYPKWEKIFSETKGLDVYFPKEIRIFDEVEKGNRSTIIIQEIDLRPLDKNIFTKAWLESKSR